MNSSVGFGYNFNIANFANVGITRTWGVLKNDYDVKGALNNSNKDIYEKQKVRKQKLAINILSNVSQYAAINVVMFKLDKHVNKNTLIAVAVPFLINGLIDIACRTKTGQKIADKFSLIKDPTIQQQVVEIKSNNSKVNPVFEKFINKNSGNVSFGVSYTNVFILGKLANKLRGSAAQTYDVYSAGKEINLPHDRMVQTTGLKFLQEMSSQLLENIFCFSVMLKFKKRIDKNIALAVFLPSAMTIGFDLLSRSNSFKFLDDWSKRLFKIKNQETVEPGKKNYSKQLNSNNLLM